MQVIIVRHGQTTWNKIGKMQGWRDAPLTSEGIGHAKEVSAKLEKEEIDAIYSSDLGRCLKTAEIIAKPRNLPIIKCFELREIKLGLFEGQSKETIKTEHSKFVARRAKDKYNISYPEGESYADIKKRVKPFLEKLEKQHANQTVLLVTSQGTTRVLIQQLLNLSEEQAIKIGGVPHTCVYKVDSIKRKVWHKIGQEYEEGYVERKGEAY